MFIKQSMCILCALGFFLSASATLGVAHAKSRNQTVAPASGMTPGISGKNQAKGKQTGSNPVTSVTKSWGDAQKIGAGSGSGL